MIQFIKRMDRGKLFYCFLAVILSMTLVVPLLLQSPTEAAIKRTPTKPVVTKVTATKDSVTITWKKSKYATSYGVLYRAAGTKKWIRVKTVSSSTSKYTHKSSARYPLKAGKRYYYTVKAYNKYSKRTATDHSLKSVTIPVIPGTVKTVKVKANNYKQTTVTWSKSGNATNYLIYYRPGSSKKWTRIAMVDSRAMKYVHKSSSKYPLKAGNTYYYTVRGYNKVFKTYGGYNKAGVKAVIPSKPQPTETPTETPEPTVEPTATPKPTVKPTATPKPTQTPKPVATPKPTQTPKPTATPTPVPNYMTEAYARKCEKEMIRLANVERKKAGLPALIENEALNRAAQIRVEETIEKFSHERPNGEGPTSVGYEAGAGNLAAEIIERGAYNPEVAISAWMESKGHREIMLSSRYLYVGAGWRNISQYVSYEVLVFADKDPDQKYALSVDANGGTFPTKGDVETFDLQVPAGATVPVSDIPVPVKEENDFKDWTLIDTVGIEYNAGSNNIHMFEDLKVKANWTPLATPIPTLTPTPTVTPEPIATPTPTMTPEPTPIETPEIPEPTITPAPDETPTESTSESDSNNNDDDLEFEDYACLTADNIKLTPNTISVENALGEDFSDSIELEP